MSGGADRLLAALRAAAAGDRPIPVALMHLLMEAAAEPQARAALEAALLRSQAAGDEPAAGRLRDVADLWAAHPGAFAAVRGTIDQIEHTSREATPGATLQYWEKVFDRLVVSAPEASVALYSLGSPSLLEVATREVIGRMEEWGLLGPEVAVLDLGCGIGRFAAALAPNVWSVVGLDLSAGMIDEARRRHGALANVTFERSSGRDLAPVASNSLGLVLAADVFPYLVEAGEALVATLFAEIARVLRPGGRVLILNFSYRGDDGQDRRDVAVAAARSGLRVVHNGTRGLASWDALTFLLAR